MLLYCCDYTPLYTVMWVMCGRCAGSVRVNGMIMTGLPCGKAGHNHDNITLYSCDRGLALLFPGANLPRYRRQSIDVCTGAEIVVPVRNFGPFSRTRTRQSPKSTYPDKQNRRNTANPEINILSRFSRRTIDVQTGATGIVPVREKHPFSQTRTVIPVLVPTSND